jgi:hypothetical protein
MGDEGDPDRDAILKRRRRFIALALGAIATQAACDPAPCLEPVFDAAAIPRDAGPRSGADASPDGSSPDGSRMDAGAGDRDTAPVALDGSFPTPCLSMAPPDAAPEKR